VKEKVVMQTFFSFSFSFFVIVMQNKVSKPKPKNLLCCCQKLTTMVSTWRTEWKKLVDFLRIYSVPWNLIVVSKNGVRVTTSVSLMRPSLTPLLPRGVSRTECDW